MTLKTKDIKLNLCKKGFAESNTDHKVFWFYVNGTRTSIRTKFSHSVKEVDDNSIHLMAAQLHLTKDEFVKLAICKIGKQEYTEIQKEPGNLR